MPDMNVEQPSPVSFLERELLSLLMRAYNAGATDALRRISLAADVPQPKERRPYVAKCKGEEVFALARQNPQGIRAADVAKAFGISRKAAHQHLLIGKRIGQLRCINLGLYVAAEPSP